MSMIITDGLRKNPRCGSREKDKFEFLIIIGNYKNGDPDNDHKLLSDGFVAGPFIYCLAFNPPILLQGITESLCVSDNRGFKRLKNPSHVTS